MDFTELDVAKAAEYDGYRIDTKAALFAEVAVEDARTAFRAEAQ